jgi:cytochrome c biogenesis protein CcmG, thiol:disulfide interchange protein DsbE
MMVNPLTGRRSTGSRLVAFALIFAAAVVLSTATVLGLRWAAAPHPKAKANASGLGFARVSRSAPAFSLPNLHGGAAVTLASLAGKPIVMNFWSSTCTICKSETPALASVARTLNGKVTFVGIDSADSRGPATAFVARYNVPYENLFDPSATQAARYGVPALPVTFFLSPSGTRILGENIGALSPSKLRSILHALYGVA